MEYEKHIKRLVLGYLKKQCKYTYKVFLKYNFQGQNKHISTRAGGQTLEDILKTYSRVEELVQGRLEDTNYYKERSIEFSSSIHLDDQLLYLLEKDGPFTPASTPCPRSPAESSVLGSYHENEVFLNNTSDVETTPEHTLPGNISSHDSYNQSKKTPCRKEVKNPASMTPRTKNSSISDRESIAEALTPKVPERDEPQNKLGNNVNTASNTPQIPCFSHRGENEKNKEGVGTELDDMLQDILGTPISNSVSKAVRVESTCTCSKVTHTTTSSRNWQHIDDHNNRAVSSILAAANIPNNKSANFVTTTNDNIVYNDSMDNFQDLPVSSIIQTVPTSASYTSSQYLLPTTVGMYSVPQPTTSTIHGGNQQQQFFIVNQPVVIPQQHPVVQLLQPIAPANKQVITYSNQKNCLSKENRLLSEQDIMSMPTIIINERNEITHADPGSFPTLNTPFKGNEARNLKEYINLFGASDQSPILKLNPQKRGTKNQPPIKPTTTIKVEVFQRETLPPNTTNAIEVTKTLNDNNSQSTSNQINTASIVCAGLPNLNETTESESVTKTLDTETQESTNENKRISDATTSDTKVGSQDKTKSRMVGATTPSPLKTKVRKPTPKSSSHVRNLTFPSPIRKTSEKPDSKRNSPRFINKQQAAKDLFGNETDEETISDIKKEKSQQSTKTAKSPSNSAGKNKKKSKCASATSAKKVTVKDKTQLSKKSTKKKVMKENALTSKDMEEDLIPKCCWDSNLRKLITPIIEKNNSTPVRRVSARRKTRQSAELEVSDLDGKKLEDSLMTPEKNEKPKRKTPSRKKKANTSNTKKMEENLNSQVAETKGETKVLSPSKLNANKRNILPNDVDDVTPSILKESSQYPVSSKTRRNISSLLETPIKEDLLPPTPGTMPDKTDTPFTPMLRANLKDFTEGDTFSINTPNFPVTPGLATMVNTSAAYYILNDNESNKVTEATVLLEEKKSSVRKSDDEDVELSPRVYGSKFVLENFNKSCIGKKNLELLDNQGVTWDGSSDREEKSGANSENNTDEESNNTVIQNQKEPLKGIKVLQKKGKTSGKCMATLHSQLLNEIKDPSECFTYTPELSSQKNLNANPQNHEENKGGGQCTHDNQGGSKAMKSYGSSNDSEVLSKKDYVINKTNQTVDQLSISNAESNLIISGSAKEKMEPKIEQRTENIRGDKCAITTQEIRQTISDVCLENTLGSKSNPMSLKVQLEEKKKRWVKLEKAKQSLDVRKTPRRASLKHPSNLNSAKSKRKPPSPKKVVKSIDKGKKDESNKSASNMKGKVNTKERVEMETEGAGINTENRTVDSQDEFFKKSGTNLHRKNKGDSRVSKEDSDLRKEFSDSVQDITKDEINERMQQENKIEVKRDYHKTLKAPFAEKSDSLEIPIVEKQCEQTSAEADISDEFEKSWDDCHMSKTQAENEVCYHDESKTPNKKLEDYDFNILQKKIGVGVPCSDGSTANITLTVSSFQTLLEVEPTDECVMTDGSREEADSSFETLELKPDAISDSENAVYKSDNADFKCAKKRKYRSDSCNSNSSTKRMKKNEIFNEMNIQKVLTKIHGPGPSQQKQV